MDVTHTAIWVSDLEASLAFFTDVLDLSERRRHSRNGTTNVYVGGESGAIQLRSDPDRTVPPGDRSRLDHIALSAIDIESVCKRVEAAEQGAVVRPPEPIEMLDVEVAFVRSPTGYAIELVEDSGRTDATGAR
jgi:lactoylglutathione lyase